MTASADLADPFDAPYALPARPRDPRTASWNEMAEEGIERDRYGRPMIKPPADGWPDPQNIRPGQLATGERPYARWSTVAQYADPMRGLGVYLQRMQALALARMPDLQAWLCGLTYEHGERIDLILTEAMLRAKEHQLDAAGRATAAVRGSTFHTYTTPGFPDPDPIFGPHVAAFDVAARELRAALHDADLEIVSTERFVINDQLECAGTYDHLVRCKRTGRVRVLDKKTGKMHWPGHRAQAGGYASSSHYDAATGERTPLHPDLDESVIYIAATDLATGRCVIWECDLDGTEHRHARHTHRRTSAEYEKRTIRLRT